MLTETPPTAVDGDRRIHPRVEFNRPCKIFHPTLGRYFLGTTQDLSSGGMLVQVGHVVDVRPGDIVHVGVATRRREQFLRSSEMLGATVVRSMTTVDDRTTIAVKFDREQIVEQAAPLRLAA